MADPSPRTGDRATTPRALVVGGNRFPWHRFETMGPLLGDVLAEAGVAADRTTDRDALAALDGYDLVVDYRTDSTLSDEQRDGLCSFVSAGGGYLGVHCAADLTSTASDDPDDPLDERDDPFPDQRDLVGGHFVDHPEQATFDVTVVDSHHPVTAAATDFSIWDEPYQVAPGDVRVLARMDHPDLGDTPVVWVHEYGDGRSCYCSLGHGPHAFANDGVRSLLRAGARWAAHG